MLACEHAERAWISVWSSRFCR